MSMHFNVALHLSGVCGRVRGKGFRGLSVDVTSLRPELRANNFRRLLLQVVYKLIVHRLTG